MGRAFFTSFLPFLRGILFVFSKNTIQNGQKCEENIDDEVGCSKGGDVEGDGGDFCVRVVFTAFFPTHGIFGSSDETSNPASASLKCDPRG